MLADIVMDLSQDDGMWMADRPGREPGRGSEEFQVFCIIGRLLYFPEKLFRHLHDRGFHLEFKKMYKQQ